MDLYGGEVVVEDVCSGERRASQETAEFVLLVCAHQFDVDSLSQVLHGLTEDRVVHQFVEILFEGAGGLLSQLGVHPNVGLHSGRGVSFPASSRVPSKAGGCGSGARSDSCRGGWGPVFDLGGRHTFAQEAMLIL